jgi:branched-chain amino acid aminotransferase
MIVWLNGDLADADEARIDPTDRGFTLGDGLFETIAAEAGRPRHLDRHLARLRAGAEALAIPFRPSDDVIDRAIAGLLTANRGPARAASCRPRRRPRPC